MMLTEKECNEALDWLYALSVPCKEEVHEHRSSFLGEKYNLIKQLIEEHFSNPPLTFEELKVGMWIWDNQLKEWRKVIEKLIVGVSEGSEFYEDIYVKGTKVIRIGLHKFDWKDILFESKRFYRKEVKE